MGKKTFFIFTIMAFFSGVSLAHSDHDSEEKIKPELPTEEAHHTSDHSHGEGEVFDPQEVIMHHIADAHDWHYFDWTDSEGNVTPYAMPLPVILYTEGNLDVFMSSGFDHGHASVTKGDRTYSLNHGHIEEASGKKIINFSITKNVAAILLTAFIMLILFTAVARSYKSGLTPTGVAKFLEPIIVFVTEDIVRPNIGEHQYKKYLPYLLTLFFFIWIINLLGLIPGGPNATGNIAVTFVLAFITLIVVNFSGNKGYWKHIFATPGVPTWLLPIMIPVEIIGVISKPFSLMIRLFANITAGHIIILSLVSLVFIFKTAWMGIPAVMLALFISVLELLVAALQAYIFTLLTALFIGLAVEEQH